MIAYAAAVASAMLFSLKGVLVKLAFAAGADIPGLMAMRYGLVMPFFALIALRSAPGPLGKGGMRARDWWAVGLSALLGYYAAGWLDFQGLRFVSVGLERLILYLHPTMVLILAILLGQKRAGGRAMAAMGLSYLGLGLCFFGEIRFADMRSALTGSAFVLASAAAYAVFLILAERLMPRIGAHRFTALGMVMAGIIALAAAGNPAEWTRVGAPVYAYAAVLALGCTLLPIYLFSVALQKLGAARLSVAGMAGPAGALLLGTWILGEPMGPWQWAGVALTLAGGALLALEPWSSAPAVPDPGAPPRVRTFPARQDL